MPLVSEYFGKDITPQESWRLEMSIHEMHRENESDLRASRWFDHRDLLPAQATYLFAAQYRNEYISSYSKTVDIRTTNAISPFSPQDIFRSSELIPMWLARRAADQIGCKYDFYLRFAFQRTYDRGWKNLPRPNQLFGEEVTLDAADAWKQRCRDVLQLAESPFFEIGAYVGHPDQDAYHAWVVAEINKREHKHLTLAAVFKKGHLPQAIAEQHFGTSVVNRALSFCKCE